MPSVVCGSDRLRSLAPKSVSSSAVPYGTVADSSGDAGVLRLQSPAAVECLHTAGTVRPTVTTVVFR